MRVRLNVCEPRSRFCRYLDDEPTRRIATSVAAEGLDETESSVIARLEVSKDPVGDDIRHLDKPRRFGIQE